MSEQRTTDQRLGSIEARLVSLRADLAETRKILERTLASHFNAQKPASILDITPEQIARIKP